MLLVRGRTQANVDERGMPTATWDGDGHRGSGRAQKHRAARGTRNPATLGRCLRLLVRHMLTVGRMGLTMTHCSINMTNPVRGPGGKRAFRVIVFIDAQPFGRECWGR